MELVVARDSAVPQYILADGLKLRQILINLFDNAIKFTDEGMVILQVSAQPPKASKGMTEITFQLRDTGVGIDPKEMNVLFTAFSQTSSGREKRQGTGLGLPISQRYVALMNGKLTVASKPGKGSIFSFTIPVTKSETYHIPSSEDLPVIGVAEGQPTFRLLVVDDQITNRQLVNAMLKSAGFMVREATNGQEAVDIVEEWQPHLIFMDMRMPIMDGFEATRKIKEMDTNFSPVIIALTASAFASSHSEMLAVGCDDVISKPFRRKDLLQMPEKYLGVRYLYEGQHHIQPILPKNRTDTAVLQATLATLDPKLLAEIKEAATQADFAVLYKLIDRVRKVDAALADKLLILVDEFDYAKILSMV